MAVSVNMPGRREEHDPLDTIAKGLSIAGSIFGIKDAAAKADQLAQQTALQKSLTEKQVAKLDREEKGILTAGEFLAQSGKFMPSREGDPGALAFRVQGEDGINTVYLKPPKMEKQGDEFATELKALRVADMQRKAEEAAYKKTPEGRLQNLNTSDKQRLDNARLALSSTQGMADALLNQGQNTFSLIGDNDFTQQRALFEEAVGRMQSGGAINMDEARRFKKMAPTAMDSPEIQKKKLIQLQGEMVSRLGTLGFKPEDVGIQLATYDKSGVLPNPSGEIQILRPPAANAASAGGHPQDGEALEWAKANPNDPRAAAILKANGF